MTHRLREDEDHCYILLSLRDGREMTREMRLGLYSQDLKARMEQGTGEWRVSKKNHRGLWRFLQKHFPGEVIEGPSGYVLIDPTPGVVKSMGLALPKPDWMKR